MAANRQHENPLERVNKEIKRRSDVVGVRPRPRTNGERALLPNGDAIVRVVGAPMLETNDEWTLARRYMTLESLARITDHPNHRLPAVAA